MSKNAMSWFLNRATEASSKGSYAGALSSIATLAADPKNPYGWLGLASAIIAFIWPDKTPVVSQ